MARSGAGWLAAGFVVALILLAVWAVAADAPAGRAPLAHRLILAIAVAAVVGPLALAVRGQRPTHAQTLGPPLAAAAGALAAGLLFTVPGVFDPPEGFSTGFLLAGIALGAAYGAALVVAALGLQRALARRLRPAAALAWTWGAVGLLFASPPLVSPLLQAAPPSLGGAGIAAVIRTHPRPVVEGSCLGLDPLRGRALYTAFPAATSYPYEYGAAWTTVLGWLLAAPVGHLAVEVLERRARVGPLRAAAADDERPAAAGPDGGDEVASPDGG